jgi:hypothetical protein
LAEAQEGTRYGEAQAAEEMLIQVKELLMGKLLRRIPVVAVAVRDQTVQAAQVLLAL